MRNSRLLTVLGGRRPYVDAFNALSPRLVPVVGTLGVNGGALRAATAGDWLGNLVANGELTANLDGYSSDRCTPSWVDSALDPGVASGGADSGAARLVRNAVAGTGGSIQQQPTTTPGATYIASALAYAPSANSASNASRLWLLTAAGTPIASVDVTAEDAWQRITVSGVSADATMRVYALVQSPTANDIAFFDGITCYRQNTAFLVAGWDTPHYVYGLDHISPASGVAPCSAKVRYTDALNYWEIRLLPNTAGNDLQIVQVTAGVETVRAEADVDWTSNDLDQLRVVVEGSVIGLEHRKKGAGSWTDSASWSAATQGLNSPQVGGLLWDTGVNRIAGITLEAR